MKGFREMQREIVSFPSNSNRAQPETDSAAAENQLSYIFPVIFALILPVLIGISGADVLPIYRYIFYVFLGSLPAVVITRICLDWAAKNESFVITIFRFLRPLKYLENLPSSLVFKTDHKKIKLPWTTLSLIICNTVIFYCVSEEGVRGFVFTPYRYWSLPRVLISVFTSAFVHADAFHLFGNMLFLLIFGSFVESKIGSTRLLAAFFLCKITSTITVVILLKLAHPDSSLIVTLNDFHSGGASGALSGIMALFVVRCFFARITVCSPFFSLPLLSLPVGIHGTLLASSFFAFDVSGSLEMFKQEIEVNYWAHLGGYFGGFALA
jgi:membrane associated rhomboid family serine protease